MIQFTVFFYNVDTRFSNSSIYDTYRQMFFAPLICLCLINLSLSILFPRPFIYSFGWRNIFPAFFLLCFLHPSPQTLYLSIWWKEYFLPLFSVLCFFTLSLQTASPSCFLVLLSFLQRFSHYLVFNLFRCLFVQPLSMVSKNMKKVFVIQFRSLCFVFG